MEGTLRPFLEFPHSEDVQKAVVAEDRLCVPVHLYLFLHLSTSHGRKSGNAEEDE